MIVVVSFWTVYCIKYNHKDTHTRHSQHKTHRDGLHTVDTQTSALPNDGFQISGGTFVHNADIGSIWACYRSAYYYSTCTENWKLTQISKARVRTKCIAAAIGTAAHTTQWKSISNWHTYCRRWWLQYRWCVRPKSTAWTPTIQSQTSSAESIRAVSYWVAASTICRACSATNE